MGAGSGLPVRMMLTEESARFRVDSCRPSRAFILMRPVELMAELVVVVNNLRFLHDGMTAPYHFYEGWLEEPTTGTAVSVGVFNTDPQGKGLLIYRFNPVGIFGHPLSFFQRISITAESQDGNPKPGMRVLG